MALSIFNNRNFTFELKLLLISILSLSIGTLMFFVSARFRILLLPIAIVISVGALQIRHVFSFKNISIVLLLALLSFTSFFNASDKSTYLSDYLLLAHSSARIFNYKEQIKWANKVLLVEPDNIDAIRMQLNAFLNMVLDREIKNENKWSEILPSLTYLDKHNLFYSDTIFLSGCYSYKFKHNINKAHLLWNFALEHFKPAELYESALLLTNGKCIVQKNTNFPLLDYALGKKKNKIKIREIVNFLFSKTSIFTI